MVIRFNHKAIDTDKLTYEEMQGLMLELDEEIQKISFRLSTAKTAFYETGERADQKWFNDATYALKALKRNRQELQLLSGQRRRLNSEKTRSLANIFMDIAYEYLPTEDFERIKAIAEKRRSRLVEEQDSQP